MSGVTVKARVQVSVLLDLPNAWGDDDPMGQVNEQAEHAAVAKIKRALAGQNGHEHSVIGEPVVTAIYITATRAR